MDFATEHTTRRRAAAVLLALALLLIGTQGVTAATVAVTVAPETDTLMVDDEIDVVISVDSAALDLKTLQVDMSYDGTIIQVLSVQMGDLYASSGHSVFFRDLSRPDTVSAAMSVLGPDISVDGPGEILVVTVRALAPGLSLQMIEEAILIDAAGDQFAYGAGDGVILVDDGTVGIYLPEPRVWLRPAVNPAVGVARIDYAAGGAGEASLIWYDIRGRRLGEMKLEPGRGQVKLRFGPAGVYWVELRQQSIVERTRVVWIP
jgi:hypothetical protein